MLTQFRPIAPAVVIIMATVFAPIARSAISAVMLPVATIVMAAVIEITMLPRPVAPIIALVMVIRHGN
jgi:hypothetical protein